MVFSSVEFLFLFLPLFLLAQNFLPWRNLSFVLFSLVFYFAGEGWFTAVVAVSVAINYVFGLRIGDAHAALQAKSFGPFIQSGDAAGVVLLTADHQR